MAQTLTERVAFRAGVAFGFTLSRVADNTAQAGNETVASARTVPQTTIYENHPLAPVSGLFAGDPLWADYLRVVREIEEEDDDAAE